MPPAQERPAPQRAPRPPNRTVPAVEPPPALSSLPASPTDAELTRARIFPEPLVPMQRPTTRDENAALAQAIRTYAEATQGEMVAPLVAFLARYPDSAWRPSLLANLGTVYRAHGYLSRALNAWERAWDQAKGETEPRARAVADFAIGEFLDLSSKVGHTDAIAARLEELGDRAISGRATQKIGMAREALAVLRWHHELAVASGPLALQALLTMNAPADRATVRPNAILQQVHTTPAGTSLSALKTLATRVGLAYEMAVRPPGTDFPVPSVIHWRVDHYSALVKKEGGRYLLLDPVLGGRHWVSAAMLNDEASGYVLAPTTALGPEWRRVPDPEAARVIGHCAPGAPDDNDPCDCAVGGGGTGGPGMATYSLLSMPASLRVTDQPLTYAPAIGPQANFRLTYNQREGGQPQMPSYGNLGPKWTFDWLSSITDDPTSADVEADVSLRGGGGEHFTEEGPVYAAHWRSRAVVAKVSTNPIRYERRLRDGGVEVFAQSDGVITAGRRVYLTDIIDPQGLTLHVTYDATLRLVAVTDATGLVTTLAYDLASDPSKITTVTDPYGRFATLTYNAAGQLASITDALGLTSSFRYGPEDFLATLTTPYGTTRFAHEPNAATTTSFRFIQATDPLGGTERVEFRWTTTDLPATAPANQVPTGFTGYNQSLNSFNSFYWDKRAMALTPGTVSNATVTHWLMYVYVAYTPFFYSHGFSTSVPNSIKRPLENRVWYAYAGQDASGITVGTWVGPTKIARVLDDGTSQISHATYNGQGQVTSRTDPVGRQTTYVYAANGIDLVETRQTSPGVNDLLGTFANYTALHQPQTVTDAAGQTTTLTYNAFGQVLTSTNAKSETTTLVYDADRHLQSVTAPMTGAVTTSTYDSEGRVRTVTQPDGYAVTTDYDAFDRPTRVTYPDATAELLAYNRLDLSARTDRLGRTTRYFYDPLRRLIATRDPAGRTITQQWCTCGSLDTLIDAKSQATTWERDVQARVTREVRADGMTATQYVYESTTNRLKTATDPKAQITTYTYSLDDSVQQVVYTNATIATPCPSATRTTRRMRVSRPWSTARAPRPTPIIRLPDWARRKWRAWTARSPTTRSPMRTTNWGVSTAERSTQCQSPSRTIRWGV